MNYLTYYEIPEAAAWNVSNDIEKLKGEWCFSMRIFEVPDEFTIEDLKALEKPRFQKIKGSYKQIHSMGHLMHETE